MFTWWTMNKKEENNNCYFCNSKETKLKEIPIFYQDNLFIRMSNKYTCNNCKNKVIEIEGE